MNFCSSLTKYIGEKFKNQFIFHNPLLCVVSYSSIVSGWVRSYPKSRVWVIAHAEKYNKEFPVYLLETNNCLRHGRHHITLSV